MVVLVSGVLVFNGGLANSALTEQERLEKWFAADFEEESFEDKALAVNEGPLKFLSKSPERPPHFMHNRLTIEPNSLETGWVQLQQCHHNLDQVGEAQILYHPNRTRNIEVVSFQGMDKAWVENNSVQMLNISEGSKICIKADVKSLYSNYNGSYSMISGPYHRRFLDGYYPMHVTLEIDMPSDKLAFEDITPQEQEGFDVSHESGHMKVDALFEGELSVEVYFSELAKG